MSNEFILSGDDLEMMGGMGASFLRRQARKVSKIARPLAHSALNLAAKVPVYGSAVTAGRGIVGALKSPPKKVVALPDGLAPPKPAPGIGGGSKVPLYLGLGLLAAGGVYLATKKRGA